MTFRIKMRITCVLSIYAIFIIQHVYGVCDWPDRLQSSDWMDSSQGNISFGTDTMQGWEVTISSSSVNEWKCATEDTFSTDGRIVMLSTTTVELFTVHYFVYLCMTFTEVTSYSYRYYINNIKQSNANNHRVFLYPVETLTDTGTICDDSGGATGAEYQFMIKSGFYQSAKIYCPWSFLGRYGYEYTSAGGTTSCDTSTSELNSCASNFEFSFDYSACSTQVANSVSNTVWCVDNVNIGDTNYVMLYNGNDDDSSIDNANVFRYTCMAIASAGNQASVSPNHCQIGQTVDQFPTDSGGNSVGGRLTFASPRESCPTCPSLSDPDRGSVTVVTDGASTSAIYTCNTNYTMHGLSTRTCDHPNEAWSSTEPFCSCATPTTPSNGALSINSQGTLVTYMCDLGYTIYGPSSRSCQLASATWDSTDPTCTQCLTIPTITGRTVSLSTSGTVTSATISCQSGYILSGSSSVNCMTNGGWDNVVGSCVACNLLTNPASGTVSIATDGVTSTATYSCSSGYSLTGTATRTCLGDGSWSGSAPYCSCNSPSTPSNGAVVSNGFTATYTCSVNYTLNGDSTRTCQQDGSGWSGSDSTCSMCTILSAVTGGGVVMSTTGTVTSAKYTCDGGYSLDGTSTITCQSDGSWNNQVPECIQCPTLSNPSSGTVTITSSGTTSTATYACASGYDISGNTIRLCSSAGFWSLSAPSCYCRSPSSIANGVMVDNGLTANYTCNTGYTLNGLASRTCGTDGSGWSGSDPSCSTCATLNTINGGSVSLTTSGLITQATFTCNTGYTINGVSTITCRSDGTWDFSQPTCSKCPDLSHPSSGTVSLSSTGTVTTASFTCSSGYYVSGVFSTTCQSDGTWSAESPSCKCNFPMTPTDGGVSVSDSAAGTVASYSCNTGYSLNGLASRVCQTDGSGWEGSDPSCALCSTLTSPTSGSFSLTSNNTYTRIFFTCDVGTTLNGATMLVCLSDGSYDNTPPTCVACPILSSPSSGSVSLDTSGYITTATYSCVTGYSLTSAGVLMCSESGQWDISAPSCLCQSPPSIANGVYEVSTNQSTITYTCDVNYVLTGSQVRHCQTDGTGWSGTTPICDLSLNTGASTGTEEDEGLSIPIGGLVAMIIIIALLLVVVLAVTYLYIRLRKRNIQAAPAQPDKAPLKPEQTCNALEEPTGGNIEYSSDGYTTTASYTCDVGYNRVGEAHQTCQADKTWNPSATTCVKCSDLAEPFGGQISLTTDGDVTTASYTCPSGYNLIGADTRTCQDSGLWDLSDANCECSSPLSPSNGNVVLNGLQASYTCDLGYSLNGQSTRACSNDGSGWSDSDPECSQCASLLSPTGGSYETSTSGTVTSASYQCNTGYTLSGNTVISCLSDGSWQTPPICVECETLPTLNSGTISLTTNGYITMATYSCASGYFLQGTALRNCSSEGTWSSTVPTCYCHSTLTPMNGFLSENGITATYGCDVGYSLNGDSTRTCTEIGSGWTGTDPSCSACDALTSPDGGTISMTSDNITTTAAFTCNIGYTLKGITSAICGSTGVWDQPSPSCIQCPTLNQISSGSVALATNGYVTTATFSCESGYYLSGAQFMVCGVAGSWNDTSPSCKCSNPSSPSNGAVSVSEGVAGPEAAYSCNVGYSLDGLAVRACQENGEGWESTDPTCAQCVSLLTPTGGSYETSTSGTVTSAAYQCNTGYTLSGNTLISCLPDGSWQTPPICVECEALSTLNSGTISLTTNGYITMATHSCASGYSLQGTALINCSSDGTWSSASPTCSCISPSLPLNGFVSDNGLTATYGCDVGYSLNGVSSRTCADDGSGWTGSDPSCSACNTLESPDGGSITLTTDSTTTTASFTCSVGYTLSGASSITCASTGDWNQLAPSCVQCPTLNQISSGSVTMATDGYVTTATFSCESGYYLSGAQYIVCGLSGSWNNTSPSCKCNIPSSPSNGAVSVSEGVAGPEAAYSCNVGYSLDGLAVRACQTNGEGWESTDPTCVTCQTLTTPTGGSISLITDGYQTQALVTCSVGYTLSGVRNMTCRSDGSWDFTNPACVQCPSLSSPSSGSVILSTDDTMTTASFSCVSGYYVSGALSVTCGTDGQWSDTAPTCKCNIPAAPSNGAVSVSDGTQGPEAYYTCKQGYSLDGSATRLCQSNGQGWDATDPVCRFCPTISVQSETQFSTFTNGTTTSVVYTCPINYTLDGVSEHICDGAGTWNHQTPSCVQCLNISAPASGSVVISSDGLTTTATFSCVFGYSLNSTSLITCQPTGTWNLPEPDCVCDPPSVISNGDMTLSTDGRIANYSCSDGFELVGTSRRYCIDDGTGWNGSSPRCDSISPTPKAAESTQKEELSVPLAAFIIMLIVILALVIAVALFTYFRLRGRGDTAKVATTFEGSDTSQPIDERTSDLNSPSDIESGKAVLIGKPAKNDTVFNVRKSKLLNRKHSEKESNRTLITGNGLNGPISPIEVNDTPTNTPDVSAVISMPNGSPENVPTHVPRRLPKLPPRAPKDISKPTSTTKSPGRRKRKSKPKTPKMAPTVSDPRTSTPLEVKMSRTATPDMLATEEFGYINQQYCYELDTSGSRPATAMTRPPTSISKDSIQTQSNIKLNLTESNENISKSNKTVTLSNDTIKQASDC